MTIISTTYGLGGFDPEHPNDNIAEQIVDNGDGTVSVARDGKTMVHSSGEIVRQAAALATERTKATNTSTLHDRAQQALTTNSAFLALASPTNAQTLAQVKALTRECTALIRLLLHQVDDITGT